MYTNEKKIPYFTTVLYYNLNDKVHLLEQIKTEGLHVFPFKKKYIYINYFNNNVKT